MFRGSFILITVVLACDAATEAPINVTCSGDEWRCLDGGCVASSQQCDGELNCNDGSDEALAQCEGTERPMFGLILHCSSPWAEHSPGVCPDICHLEPKFCYYAFLANRTAGACPLPQFPTNGSYSITDLNPSSTPADFSLHFACNLGTALDGDSVVRCENGTWTQDFPNCVEACELLLNKTVHTAVCEKGTGQYPCPRFVPTGALVTVQKPVPEAPGDDAAAVITCGAGGHFNLSEQCVNEIDKIMLTFENDTMKVITDYDTNIESFDVNTQNFELLVEQYDRFDKSVRLNSTLLTNRVGECEIHLDLLSLKAHRIQSL